MHKHGISGAGNDGRRGGRWLPLDGLRRFAVSGLVAAMATSGVVVAASTLGTAPAAATPVSPSTSSCSATDTTQSGSAESAVVPGVHPGDSLAVSCSGLPAGASLAVVEVSPLGGVITPSSDAQDEADLSALVLSSATSGGDLTATFGVPSSFAASDPNAKCPPTQAQVNAGLVNCALVVATTAGVPENEILLDYSDNPAPVAPTLALSPVSGPAGTSVSASDASGATSFWWGDGLTSVSIPASNVLVGTTPAGSSSLQVSASSYAYDSTTPADSVLTPPKLSGSFTVPSGVSAGSTTVSVYEPNSTPFPGNSTNSSFANDVTASASFDVTSAVTPLSVSTTSLPSGTVGQAYSATLAASGGTAPYSWSLSGGSLPTGLSLSTNGVISGTPTVAGTSNFTVKVTDEAGASATAALSITIASAVVTPPPSAQSFSALMSDGSADVGPTLQASGITGSASGTVTPGTTSNTFGLSLDASALRIDPFVARWFGVIPVPVVVSATTTWAGTATRGSSGMSVVLRGSLAARVDLFGLRCRLGPIHATFTTGQSGSLTGTPLAGSGSGPYVGTLVDGDFAVPAVVPSPGCSPLAAFLTDILLGLPAAAGESAMSIDVAAFVGTALPDPPSGSAGAPSSGIGGLPGGLPPGLLGPVASFGVRNRFSRS